MAIEIKELSIKVQVSSQNNENVLTKKHLEELKAQIRREIIDECVERVLENLEYRTQR